MVWHKATAWNEDAFLRQALPELTTTMGLHFVLDDLDNYQDSDTDISLIDPEEIAQLRKDWLLRAKACFPDEWHRTITSRVASPDNFYLTLVAHLDQVRFTMQPPAWIKVMRNLAIGFAFATLLAIALVIIEPFSGFPTQAAVVVGEVMPILAAGFGLSAAVGRDTFRTHRAQAVSTQINRELAGAIRHAFVRPISEAAAEMTLLKELSWDEV